MILLALALASAVQDGTSYFARQQIAPRKTSTTASESLQPQQPSYSGTACGVLEQGWQPASTAGAVKIADIYYGSAAENALRARAMCNAAMTGPGTCYITLSSHGFAGLSSVWHTSSPGFVRSADPEHYGTICNAR